MLYFVLVTLAAGGMGGAVGLHMAGGAVSPAYSKKLKTSGGYSGSGSPISSSAVRIPFGFYVTSTSVVYSQLLHFDCAGSLCPSHLKLQPSKQHLFTQLG
jgi:hypothetical protein